MRLLAFIHAHLGDARALFRRAMLFTFLEGLMTAGPVVAVALGLMRLAQGPADLPALLPYALAVVAAVALRIVLIRLAWSSGFRAGNVATEAIRNRLVAHMRAVPLGALGRWSAARLASLVTEDGRWINEASTFTLNRLFGGLAAGLCLLLAAAWFDPATALAVLFAFGLGLLSLPVAGRLLKRVIARRNAELTDISQRIGEYGEGIAVFRSFRAGEGAFARFAEAADRLRRLMLGYTPVLVSLHGVAATLMGAGLPLALMILAWRGGEAAPSLIPALLLGLAAGHALSAAVLGQMLPFSLGMQAEAGMARFLAEPALAHRGREPGTPLDFALERVSFSHDGRRGAVDGIALAARQGGMTAIVGPSGAGKSSVVGLMMRFFDPQSGRVTVGGVDIADIPPARLQALTALVNQDVHLFRDTLRANILLGAPGADEARLAAAIRAARLEELIAALPDGLDTVIGEGGRTLSGGERQRVAVARALLKDAPILLLDEASSAMDPLTERAIQQAVAALEDGRTLVVVAHRLRSIAEADRIHVMDRGRIVEEGRHPELLARGGLYARLWQAQERAAGWRLR
ncbi:ABC transporter ATP-binding protein [Bosea minatitlanensis]|uniref:ABC transporter ATP-binding protein n=1 Tax=Bosea minatitlanensis TaxID=128782 RepID=A0ABW0F9Q6_9HYPH|nr:ABC transporter ATP-binding protein [Bosea minatitlanensis]MCT4494887.1 ABC transporter ATP-binding protein/permease [Bosea minatitlanensis]